MKPNYRYRIVRVVTSNSPYGRYSFTTKWAVVRYTFIVGEFDMQAWDLETLGLDGVE